MVGYVSEADATRMRVRYDTEYEFLVEHDVFTRDDHPTRSEIRDAIRDLPESKRQLLDATLYERRMRLEDLLDGTRREFDEPRAEQDDIPSDYSGCWRNR